MKFWARLGKSGVLTLKMTHQAYGSKILSQNQVFRWLCLKKARRT